MEGGWDWRSRSPLNFANSIDRQPPLTSKNMTDRIESNAVIYQNLDVLMITDSKPGKILDSITTPQYNISGASCSRLANLNYRSIFDAPPSQELGKSTTELSPKPPPRLNLASRSKTLVGQNSTTLRPNGKNCSKNNGSTSTYITIFQCNIG